MTSQEILRKYIEFFEKRDHKLIPNVSLVPSGDSTLLFVNSGMFPLVPYLSGESHPSGKRLVNVQRAVRFEDLDEIGDNRHTTVFHMIGNWSLGDYFKAEQLPWIWKFMVEILGLDINKMYATVFSGNELIQKDEESITLLKSIFNKYGIEAKEGERIFTYKNNWWKRGDAVGELGGPDSEIYYYIGKNGNGLGLNPEENEDQFIEIGNSVFMQYKKTETGWEELPQKNVDFGGGFERITMMVQNKQDIFETDNFWPIINKLEELSNQAYLNDAKTTQAMRIIADHLRASVFMAMDGVVPSNKDQGYALRRLIRRMVRYSNNIMSETSLFIKLVPTVCEMFAWIYPDLPKKVSDITQLLSLEEEKFRTTLRSAYKEVEKELVNIGSEITHQAKVAFDLYQSYGYPPEMLMEDLREHGFVIGEKIFMQQYQAEFAKHQADSRLGAEQKFKGGLADNSEQVTKYHTATHLLHWALRQVLGEDVVQHGSNITGERLRFDFNYDVKLTDEQIRWVENLINEQVQKSLPVNFVMMKKNEAERTGAIHAFNEKYPDEVKIYFIGDSLETAISKEFCGGPHVKNTGEIGELKIIKQESVGKGLRRLYVK